MIGIVQACSSLKGHRLRQGGAVMPEEPPGWRGIYFIGGVPLLLVAIARRGLQKQNRFAALAVDLYASGACFASSYPIPGGPAGGDRVADLSAPKARDAVLERVRGR